MYTWGGGGDMDNVWNCFRIQALYAHFARKKEQKSVNFAKKKSTF